jgi:competence protein ComEC
MKKTKTLFLIILLALIMLLTGCGDQTENKAVVNHSNNVTKSAVTVAPNKAATTVTGKLVVSFIDVGQGDSELLQLPDGQNMLIDAGTNETGSAVVSYLNSKGIKKIDYLIATHPHEDHIGGMDNVIKGFDIGSIYMPKVTTTTKSFEDVLNAIKLKSLKIIPGKAGLTIFDQNGLKISFVAPCGSNYEDLNNWSIVTKVQFGNTSFLLTGDAQELSESEMLKSGVNLKADVLKVGHHGSYSSTSPAFLKAVAPKYAVISVGKGNDYGHPHQVTLDKLAAAGVTVYRTDQNGTVVITSDGKDLTIKALGSSIQPRAPNAAVTSATTPPANTIGYIGNKNSKKFHLPSCSSLPAVQNRVYFKTRDEAIKAGFVPCKVCNP